MKQRTRYVVSGVLAGVVNGLFGGGGGMVLVPLLRRWCGLEERRAFATCVAVILPLCVVSAAVYVLRRGVDLTLAAPYLLGGLIGGFLGGRLFPKVSAGWLRYLFAAFLLYGGVRYLLVEESPVEVGGDSRSDSQAEDGHHEEGESARVTRPDGPHHRPAHAWSARSCAACSDITSRISRMPARMSACCRATAAT